MKLFALLITVATAIGVVVVPVSADATEAATAEPAVRVVFSAAGSGVVTPGADISLSGSITNISSIDLAAGTATAYIDRDVVASRADLTNWTTSSDSVALDKLGSSLASVTTPAIAPGRTVAINILVPAAAVGIAADAAWGARLIAMRVASGEKEVGQSRSSIVWDSANTVAPVSLALATPLTVPASGTGLISAATLATDTAPNGLLTRQLDQSIGRRIAIGIDPMVIVSIRILGSSAPPSAVSWLERLSLMTNETFPLTYADSDLAAAHQAGATGMLAPTSFAIDPKLFPGYTAPPTASPTVTPAPDPTATPLPTLWTTKTIANWTYTPSLAGVAWPNDNTVVGKDLDAFSTDGFTTTILSSGNVSYPDLDHTPSASATVDNKSIAVSDSQLSTLFRAAVAAPDDESWQKAFADLSAGVAVVANQRGGGARELLATLDRSSPGDSGRVSQTIQALAALPWASIGKLADVVSSATPTTASLAPKPESSERISTVRALLAAEAALGSFSSILADPTVLTGERRLSLLATLSNSWNSALPAWKTQAAKYQATSDKTLASVQIARTGSQALLSDTVNLGVAVTNDLPWPVSVAVTVRSPTGAIQIEKVPISLTVEGNSQTKASVPVRALANGDVTLRASLASATGVTIGHGRDLDVNVQAGWESLITIIFAIFVLAVFGFGIYRNIAKRRKKKPRNGDLDVAG